MSKFVISAWFVAHARRAPPPAENPGDATVRQRLTV